MDVKKKLEFINNYLTSDNAASGSKYDANANVTQKTIASLAWEVPKKDNIELNRAMVYNKLKDLYGEDVSKQYLEDLSHKIIYKHDETSLIPDYCAAISMYPFLLNGLKDIGGSSLPPQNVDSFVGGFCNLVYIAAGQLAGALATPEALLYMDYFLRKDYGEDYYLKEGEVIILSKKPKTIKDKIESLFQQIVYTINQPSAGRGAQAVFWNIAYFDRPFFDALFGDFVFPDGTEPVWDSLNWLQKTFMKWFNKERLKTVLTFPVETVNLLNDENGYVDKEWEDFTAEMLAEGHSFFIYRSDTVDSLASCCRLKNAISLEENTFSYTLGAGAIQTGSKSVITLNINRIVQDWYNSSKDLMTLKEYLTPIVERVHKYLIGFNEIIWDYHNAGLLTTYQAGFNDLNKKYLTTGINSLLEGAEFLGHSIHAKDTGYQQYVADVLGTIKDLNTAHRTERTRFNTELVPKVCGDLMI